MQNFLRLIRFLAPYRRQLVIAGLLTVVTLAGDLATPAALGWTVDRGLGSRRMDLVLFYSLLLIALAGIRSLAAYYQGYVQNLAGQSVVRDLRHLLYARLQDLPLSFYRSMPTGQIMSRLTSDVEAVQEFVAWGLLFLIAGFVSFIGTLVILVLINWKLSLSVLIPTIPLAVAVVLFNRRIGPAWEGVREQMGRLTTVLQEAVSGVRVVKAFARESYETKRFGAQNEGYRAKSLYRAGVEARSFPTMDLFMGLCFVLLAWYGGRLVMRGEVSMGTFFAYQWYLWGVIWPVRMMGWLLSIMRQALAATPRLLEILDAPITIADASDAVELPPVRGEIRFEDVWFAFPDEPERMVLKGLNLVIEPGQTVAILGGTGSGKSSVINLIPRFNDVVRGAVKIDGYDVRQVQLKSLRRQIGIVPQETFLFSATVRENIAFGRPDATQEEIEEVAKLAKAHDFIMALPKGYDTRVGERGIGLSGGQKQRIALARALLMNPRILILDEATSSVDTETEYEIQQALEQVMATRTAVVIAQRLSTVKTADKVVVLKDGRVVEEGTHAELLARGGEYTRLYHLQFREQEELTASSLQQTKEAVHT
ncbi:MAG: ABC transporter ATP-binding protein [Anaerolineae bacterium]|nr:ABC transporter ATP-binding protein/permease [Anaerolineae bacterium]MDW8100773.1 ABC transporter ATP-binding protein [Anaerolineae bacterium]